MRRMARSALAGLACAGVLVCLTCAPAVADPVAAHPAVTDPGAAPAAPVVRAPVRRGPTRLRVYRTLPGPNAVRQCETQYEQEFRPAGTVIVPRIHCWWES